jgi:hypothetical protein
VFVLVASDSGDAKKPRENGFSFSKDKTNNQIGF